MTPGSGPQQTLYHYGPQSKLQRQHARAGEGTGETSGLSQDPDGKELGSQARDAHDPIQEASRAELSS